MRFFSPAKVNLFFRVLRKRSDGYHEIASLYQAIDLGDWITFCPSDHDELTCSPPTLPCDETNLISKARALFRTHINLPPVHIHLEKQIPMQAGLGGGSSNAATTLWALNQLTNTPLSTEQLMTLGSFLGSDVPFFFSSGTAFCTGRGEIIAPFSLSPVQGMVEKPPYGLSTPEVYRNVRVDKLPLTDVEEVLRSFRDGHLHLFNDLEYSAFQLEPRLRAFKEELLSQFKTVSMTGSGTAFFCLSDQGTIRSIQRTASTWYQ